MTDWSLSLQIDRDNHPAGAYRLESSGLRVLRCDDPICDPDVSVTTTTVAATSTSTTAPATTASTANPASSTTVPTTLPNTGSDSTRTLTLLSGALLVLGALALHSARRPMKH